MARTRTFGRWQPAIEISCTLSHRILHRAPSVQACLEVRTDRSRQSLSIRAKYDSGGQSRTSSDDRARSSRTNARSIGEPECLRRAMQRGSTIALHPGPSEAPPKRPSCVCARARLRRRGQGSGTLHRAWPDPVSPNKEARTRLR